MGGFGSGRRYQGGKDTTGNNLALDVRRLQREHLLKPGLVSSLSWSRRGEHVASIQIRIEIERVVLNYRSRSRGGEWQVMDYPVFLEWTALHFGGRRAWFRCPAEGCGRRVAILYGGEVFACRHCHRLAYECQREAADDRAMRRADSIRRRLGWEAGIANPEGGKPKWMHWRTFERLKAEHDAFASASLKGMAERLGLMKRRFAGLGIDPLDHLGRDC
jgi:hypothetical protein